MANNDALSKSLNTNMSAVPAQNRQPSLVADWVKNYIPLPMRMFVDALKGRKDVFTEKDLTPDELNKLRIVITEANKNRFAQLNDKISYLNRSIQDTQKIAKSALAEGRKDIAKEYDAKTKQYVENKNHLEKQLKYLKTNSGSVNYGDYDQTKAGEMTTVFGVDPIAYSLGRFTYQTDPKGQTSVKDTYEFSNPSRDESVKEYSKMNQPEKILNIVKRSLVDGAQPLSEIGNAYIGKEGYPVDIKLPKQ